MRQESEKPGSQRTAATVSDPGREAPSAGLYLSPKLPAEKTVRILEPAQHSASLVRSRSPRYRILSEERLPRRVGVSRGPAAGGRDRLGVDELAAVIVLDKEPTTVLAGCLDDRQSRSPSEIGVQRPKEAIHPCALDKEALMNVTRLTLTAGVLAGVLCSGVLEAAAQPQQPLLGCVKPGTGLLRIPPPSEGCKPGETPLGFNDLPLLVALRTQVEQLQEAVKDLQERLASVEACTDRIPACNPE